MKFLILCLLLAGVVYGDSEAAEERSLTNEKATYRGYCYYPYYYINLPKVYDRAYFSQGSLSSGRFCYTIVQSPTNTYQTYRCTLGLRQYAYFIIRSSSRYYASYYCRSSSCYTRFTIKVPSNRVYTFMRAGQGSAGYFFCTVQAVPGASSGNSIPFTRTCRCGQRGTARIVGGGNANTGEYPFMAQILPKGSITPFCGGTLISNYYVVTAAHCTAGKSPSNTDIGLGVTRSGDFSRGRRASISRIIDHPRYTSFRNGYDISLVKLSSPISLTSSTTRSIRPICLPTGSSSYANTNALAIGWGRLSQNGPQPTILQELVIPVVTNSYCRSRLGSIIRDNIICAGGRLNKGICYGDSGGSLLNYNSGKYDLIGVTSFTVPCARLNYPAGFTRVTEYIPWIASIARDSLTCSSS